MVLTSERKQTNEVNVPEIFIYQWHQHQITRMLGVSDSLVIITPEKVSKLKNQKPAIPTLCNVQDQGYVQYILPLLRQNLLSIHPYIQNICMLHLFH